MNFEGKSIKEILPYFGHRNWIAVVDAAYPLQSKGGVITIIESRDFFEVLEEVVQLVEKSDHLNGTFYVDSESNVLAQIFSSSKKREVDHYLERRSQLLADMKLNEKSHGEIIQNLDEAANNFQVLVIKTPLKIAYTSVFINLECGYWSPENESILRKLHRG